MQLAKTTNKTLAMRKSQDTEADFVPHLRLEEVVQLAKEAEGTARAGKGQRDSLLIQTLFDGCFRVAEGISLTPESLVQTEHGWIATERSKGGFNSWCPGCHVIHGVGGIEGVLGPSGYEHSVDDRAAHSLELPAAGTGGRPYTDVVGAA